jgi:tRNA (guanine-N7-)-methyltransferase
MPGPDAHDGRRRAIRSFVRRAGRLTAPQQRAIDELWPAFGVDYSAAPLDFDRLFGRSAARVLEIGFGNGETLVQQALENPALDFIGIEVHEPGIGHCLIAARKAGIGNLRLIAHDAVEVLSRQVPHESLCRINLYFPDPWPKKRHHKRRIVSPSFVELCAERLQAGGHLHIATDWANYAEHIDATLAASGRFTLVERREHDGDQPLDRPETKFERRGLRHGHRIVDWRFSKTSL